MLELGTITGLVYSFISWQTMTLLPQGFEDFNNYFEESVLFLQKYSWLYEIPVTNILTCNVISKVPKEWINPLLELSMNEFNDVPTGLKKVKNLKVYIKYLKNQYIFIITQWVRFLLLEVFHFKSTDMFKLAVWKM